MKLLMLTNYPPVDVQKKQNRRIVNEGWIQGLQEALLNQEDICLHVLYPQTLSQTSIEDTLGDRFFACGYYEKGLMDPSCAKTVENQIYEYIQKHDFDVIHIMGTEFPHAFYAWNACKRAGCGEHTVVSLQGLISLCAKHYLYGVPAKYQNGHSILEMYTRSSLKKEVKAFEKRGEFEKKLLAECKHVIGRTSWDKRCARLYNPDVCYHYNSENLRPLFYEGKEWSLDACEKHSIFVSQGTYALKGLHHILRVLPEIVARYPDTKLYVGGNAVIHPTKWKRSSYATFLSRLIEEGGLKDHVVFCGSMDAEKMRDRYLRSHVFLSPSNIENSSNSIAEAMILGVPTVASAVGGTDSILTNGVDGLSYPPTEHYIMAQEIMEIFSNGSLSYRLSKNALARAHVLYNRTKNISDLLQIYKEIAKPANTEI